MAQAAKLIRKQRVSPKVIGRAGPCSQNHDFATALHAVGAMGEINMRQVDELCLSPRPDHDGAEVRRRVIELS